MQNAGGHHLLSHQSPAVNVMPVPSSRVSTASRDSLPPPPPAPAPSSSVPADSQLPQLAGNNSKFSPSAAWKTSFRNRKAFP